jgi:hypothetical protein
MITLEFWREAHPCPEERGRVFVVEIPEMDFIGMLEKILVALGCGE